MGFSLGSIGKGVGGMLGMGGGGAAGDASKAMMKANRKAGALYDPAYQDIKSMYNPYMQTGNQANTMLQSGTADYNSPLLRRFSDTDFKGDPGYQWRLQQGMDALQGSASAKGGLFSGAAGKAINEYGQGFASNEYNNAYNRYSQDQANQYSRLFGLAGMGMQAAGGIGDAKQWSTGGQADALMGIGNAKASGYLGKQAQKQAGFENLMSLGSMFSGMGGKSGGGGGGSYLNGGSFDMQGDPNMYKF